MSDWDDGYVAAALHDIGKLLLKSRPGKSYSGSWRGNHASLGNLGYLLSTDDVRKLEKALGSAALDLEDPGQNALIKFHHARWSRPEKHVGRELAMAAVALQFADRAHKALYFWEEGSGSIPHLNLRCPWYYPFWGEVKKWEPDCAHERFIEAALRIQDRVKDEGLLDAPLVVRLGEDLLSDFGDSSCLPVTSLHFHNQLSAALYLMTLKQLEETPGIPVRDTKYGDALNLRLNVTRTVITLPPERLRYRLRDAMHLRKISQHLLLRLHEYFKDTYLSDPELARRGFVHPRLSPFVFYGKEAIVLLNRREDDRPIREIAEEVARKTDTPFRIDRQPWLLGNQGATESDRTVPLDTLSSVRLHIGWLSVTHGKAETEWAMPDPVGVEEASHECAACHKPIPDGQQVADIDDNLCQTCYTIRRKYRECTNGECAALFPPATKCPLCGSPSRELEGPGRLIQALAEFEGERVAIIALRIGATPEQMTVESELRLAQFRAERLPGEGQIAGRCGLSPAASAESQSKAEAYMPLVHGTGGVLEYLQAVLEIERQQEKWLKWLVEQGRPAQIVYLSPAFMVLLSGESWLGAVYRKLKEGLADLHLAHRLDIVTCDTHYPIYDALAPLFVGGQRELRRVERGAEVVKAALEHRKQTQDTYRAWVRNTKKPPTLGDAFRQTESKLRDLKDDVPYQGLSWRVVRGGQEREFTDDLAHALLTAEPSRQSAAQLHAVAGLAESLASVTPNGGDGAIATLQMDVDGRRELTDSGRAAVLDAITGAESGRMTLTVLAQYLRELARATRPT